MKDKNDIPDFLPVDLPEDGPKELPSKQTPSAILEVGGMELRIQGDPRTVMMHMMVGTFLEAHGVNVEPTVRRILSKFSLEPGGSCPQSVSDFIFETQQRVWKFAWETTHGDPLATLVVASALDTALANSMAQFGLKRLAEVKLLEASTKVDRSHNGHVRDLLVTLANLDGLFPDYLQEALKKALNDE